MIYVERGHFANGYLPAVFVPNFIECAVAMSMCDYQYVNAHTKGLHVKILLYMQFMCCVTRK